jgi:hypothetical protein
MCVGGSEHEARIMKSITFAMVLVSLLSLSAVPVQAQQITTKVPALRGNVNVDIENSQPLRLSRPQRASASANTNNFVGTAQTAQTDTVLDPNSFKSAPVQQSSVSTYALNAAENFARMLTSKANAAPPPPSTASKTAPYLWYQNGGGGYWDGSGTTKDIVRADRLYQYGGKFADGTPVPKEPITSYNAMGHAYKQAKLNTGSFWTAAGR